VQSSFDPCTIIVAKLTDPLNHILQVRIGHRLCTQDHLPFWEPALGMASEVHYDLKQVASVIEPIDRIVDIWRESSQ